MNHGKILEDIQQRFSLTPTQMSEVLGVTNTSFYNFLKKESFSRSLIALLCNSFPNVTPATFGKPHDYFKSPHVPDFDSTDNSGDSFVSYSSYVKQVDSTSAFIEEYFRILRENTLSVKANFFWYEYLPLKHSRRQWRLKTYYNTEFRTFQDELLQGLSSNETEEARYLSVIALDENITEDFKFLNKHQEAAGEEEIEFNLVHTLIQNLNYERFNHIVQAFLTLGDRFKLKLTDHPNHLFSYMIVDYTTLLELHNTYRRKEKEYDPDILSAYSYPSEEERIDTFIESFFSISNGVYANTEDIDFSSFYCAFNDLCLEYHLRIENLEQKTIDIREELEAFSNSEEDNQVKEYELRSTHSKILNELITLKETVDDLNKKQQVFNSAEQGEKPLLIDAQAFKKLP